MTGRTRTPRKAVAALLLAIACAGCASSANLPTLSLSPDATVYRLGGGDQLKVTVYGEEQLGGTYAVNGQGKVALPLIGEIQAEGKTVSEFQQALATAWGDGFVNNPSVAVEVANYRPYYILGEVNKPGEYSFTDGLSVFSAVARAGGFTYRADKKRIFIRHKSGGDEELYRLEGNTPVQPGDTLRIGERLF